MIEVLEVFDPSEGITRQHINMELSTGNWVTFPAETGNPNFDALVETNPEVLDLLQ